MSFKAKFTVAGKEFRVLNSSFDLSRAVDSTGRPSSGTMGGRITVTVESTQDTDLFEWQCNSHEKKEGSLVFLKRDSDATMKELKFKEAHMVKYEEVFSSTSEEPMSITFTISANEIELGNGKFNNNWAL